MYQSLQGELVPVGLDPRAIAFAVVISTDVADGVAKMVIQIYYY